MLKGLIITAFLGIAALTASKCEVNYGGGSGSSVPQIIEMR